jgi:hypothetical protein
MYQASTLFSILNSLDISVQSFRTLRCKKGKCNMPPSPNSDTFGQLENTIFAEIEEINNKVRELLHQKRSLEDVLIRARQKSELVRRADVTRKNSVNRILVEGAILESIRNSRNPVRPKRLFVEARGLVPSLCESTFRSYLFRMKARGLIVEEGRGYSAPKPQKQA